MSFKIVGAQVREQLKGDEAYKGAFIGNCMPPIFWFFIIGPLAFIMIKQYLVTVTDKRLYFTRLNVLGKPEVTDDFEYSEIGNFTIKNYMLGKTATFVLNDRKLSMLVQFHKGNKDNVLGPDTLDFLKEKFV